MQTAPAQLALCILFLNFAALSKGQASCGSNMYVACSLLCFRQKASYHMQSLLVLAITGLQLCHDSGHE